MPDEQTYQIVETGSTASNLGWYRLGSPMTPYIGMWFRSGGGLIIYPNPENKVYIENAQFDVIDSQGASSASITLTDPDFVNLERLFLRAIWDATSARNNELWYLKVFWGWAYYGGVVRNVEDDPAYQNKTSGYHYYMLRDLKYSIEDVELRVTFDLIDISQKVLDPDEHGPNVGIVSGVKQEVSQEIRKALRQEEEENRELNQLATENASAARWLAYGQAEERKERAEAQEASQPTTTQETDTESGERPAQNNVFWRSQGGYSHWEVIQKILDSHGIKYVTVNGIQPETDNNTRPIIVSERENLYTAVRNLSMNVPQRINTGGGEEYKEQWAIMPGTWVTDDGRGAIIFGYKPVQPSESEKAAIINSYEVVRTWVYRPSYKSSLGVGVSTVKSFSFSWDSQGPWGPVAPKVYASVKGPDGKYKIYFSETEFQDDKEAGKIIGELKIFKEKPNVKGVNLEDAVRELDGVELKFNFEPRNESPEAIEQKANTLIINMWNFFLSYIIEVDIEVFGDPWLDNTMMTTTENTSKRGDRVTRLLINLFQSRFKILVYRADGQISTMLSGDYMCFQGCSHKISEGEYTTSLKLLKIVEQPR